jgi:hypothetical protein
MKRLIISSLMFLLIRAPLGFAQAYIEVAPPLGNPPHYIQLTWTASASRGVNLYEIWRSTTNGGPYRWFDYAGCCQYQDGFAQSGVTYYYVVTAVVGWGGARSAPSNQASAMGI